MKRYETLTLEDHIEIGEELNKMRRKLQDILNKTSRAAPRKSQFNKLLWKMVGGGSNVFSEVRSSLENDMYANCRDRCNGSIDMTKIYFPGDKND